MSSNCSFSTEYHSDHLNISYSVQDGEMEIHKMHLDGIPVKGRLWDEVIDFADWAAFDDFIQRCEQAQEDTEVSEWELRELAKGDTWQG